MKFKTRLRIAFASIVFLPLILTALAFLAISVYLVQDDQPHFFGQVNYAEMVDSVQSVGEQVQMLYQKLADTAVSEPQKFEDTAYLQSLNKSLNRKNSYILVRKNDSIYYAGNMEAAELIFDKLPEYGYEYGDAAAMYFNDLQKYVKQVDFRFTDGSEGSVFIVTRISGIISKRLLIDMFIAICLILLFTSLMLTQWIHKGVFTPVNELNVAMQKVKEGNFDYRLSTDASGEIGDLYRNYEDMRLRLKETTEEQLQQEKQNKELISNISHDLKTPITAIKGYMEGIMDGVADTPEKMDKYIKTVYNKANDMDRLINELTTYSGIDSNKIPYHFHVLNIADYFQDCVEEVGLDLEQKDIQLNYTNLAPADTCIVADPEQLKKVINNIISNSVKYMGHDKGIIDIRILDEGESVRIEIEDNGKGIAAKDIGNIFERFYRTDSSRNSLQGGSGIGLSIVKKIIEDHGGYVWATSKEGEGTCMHFVIRKYTDKKENNDEVIV